MNGTRKYGLILALGVGAIAHAERILPEPLFVAPPARLPEPEASLTALVATATSGDPASAAFAAAALDRHAWALWAAVTAPSTQSYENQPLRVFETWLTPEDLLAGRPQHGSRGAIRRLSQLTSADPR